MQFFKRLELHGFKSFAHKTTIDFFPGITVIVGPNGCGKSNIFDSIRWVLGEQSAKSLRGARMGDVIFSGSGGLKASGLSRVDLVLNNTERTLPIDFDEVAISRRLFRTGESEYLLNKTNCRMRDITGLFLDTGVGTDSYSVLEQGKVDAIINSKPRERRAIFDEAAGISKYKVRKDEAMNKLARTEEDLVRLADIIAEVTRQTNGLKRQAAKAARHARISAELRRVEMQLLLLRYTALRDRWAEGEAAADALAKRTADLSAQMEALETDELAGRTSEEETLRRLDDERTVQIEISAEEKRLEGEIALLEQQTARDQQREEVLAQDITAAREQQAAAEEVITELTGQIAVQEDALAALRRDHERSHAALEELRAKSGSAEARLSELRQQIGHLTRERFERDNDGRTARARSEQLASEHERLEAERIMLEQQLEAMRLQRDEHQTSAEEASSLLTALRTDMDNARRALDAARTALSEAATAREQAREEAQRAQSRHDALAELQENFDGYYKGVRDTMVAAREGQLGGIIGVVTTCLEVDDRNELAIEVALGSQAQHIVVERAEDAEAAIAFIKARQSGRITCLPLDTIRPRPVRDEIARAASEPGVIGLAVNLVRHEERLRPVIEYLLGSTLVVDTLQTAVRLARKGVRAQFVTPEGDVLSTAGAMSGGSIKAAGLLHRTRELRELADAVASLRTREEELAAVLETQRTAVAAATEQQERIAGGLQSHEIEAAHVRKEYEVAQSRLAEKEAQHAQTLTRLAEVESGRAHQESIIAETASDMAELSSRLAALETESAGLESGASEQRVRLDESASEVSRVLLAISKCEGDLRNLRDRLESAQRDKTRIIADQTARQSETQAIRARREESATALTALRSDLAALRERMEAVVRTIEIETQKRAVIELDLKRLGERKQVLRRDLNEAQNLHHEAQLQQRELETQTGNQRLQAEEKFGCSLNDVIAAVFGGETADTGIPELDESDESAEGEAPAAEVPEPASVVDIAPEDIGVTAVDLPTEETITAEHVASFGDAETIAQTVAALRERIETMGPVNTGAVEEYRELSQRRDFLTEQERDLTAARAQLTETVAHIDETSRDLFTKAFAQIRTNFEEVFRRLFGGGRADLLLTEEDGVLEAGIDIVAQPPGKKPQHISLLSGGEKALTAVALLFAIFLRKPSPFCILDEIDAPLDDKNVERFKELVREFASTTQFIIITHNKLTMALADTIYGVTMEEAGVSRLVSLRLDQVGEGGQFVQQEAELAG